MAKGSGPSKRSNTIRFLLTVGIMVMMMAATLGVFYYYMNYLIAKQYREGFKEDDLNAPVLEERPFEMEEPPLLVKPYTSSKYVCTLFWPVNGTSRELTGYEGVGAVLNLSLRNDGRTRLYIERVELWTGWGMMESTSIGRYVGPGLTRYLRHVMIDIPSPLPPLDNRTFKLSLDILIEGPQTWERKEGVEFEGSTLSMVPIPLGSGSPEMEENYFRYFDKVNSLIERDLPGIGSWVSNTSLGDAPYTIQSLVDAHHLVTSSITYIGENQSRSNEWLSPLECLARGGGDCEDYALLYGAVITVLGGSARVVITKDHAFNAVYLGADGSMLHALNERFGAEVPFFIMRDELGEWLIVEPQSSLVFGWPPVSMRPEEGNVQTRFIYGYEGLSWNYDAGDEVYIVDIYLSD